MPRFSVIIPCYNRATLIGRTLLSVFDQTFQDFEIVVVDDGSTDNSIQVVEQYKSVRLFRQANAGPGAARNRALAEACGEYVAILDSDDIWFPWTLEYYETALRKFDNPAWVSGNEFTFHDEAAIRGITRAQPVFDHSPDLIQYSQKHPAAWLPPSAVTIRTETFRQVGGYAPEKIWAEDLDLWLKLGTAKGFVRIDTPYMVAMRQHPNNISKMTPPWVRGLNYILDCEARGGYPGGPARRRGRHAMITFPIRNCSLRCLDEGLARDGIDLYWRTFGWHIMEGRLKFLTGFPLIAAWKSLTRRGAHSAARKELSGGARL